MSGSTRFPPRFCLFGELVWSCCQASAQSCVLPVTEEDTDEASGSHAGVHSSVSFLFGLSVSHFNAELIQCGWAGQDQPSGSALLLRARQEVAGTAACNPTWDFVWVTYIVARFTFYCKASTALFLRF